MKYRKLRIAFSAVCGMLCLLLILLWVRSYWWDDYVKGPWNTSQRIRLSSCEGWLTAALLRAGPTYVPWKVGSDNLNERYELDRKFIESSGGRGSVSHRIPKFGFRGSLLQLPYWFVTAIVAAFTPLPWLRWRFSLRTLLIATTLIALALGIIIATTR